MNNDSISRSALKKKIEEVQYTQEFCIEHQIDYSVSMHMLGMVIDNAPTVNIQTAVMELYRRYQPRLATNVYEFGVELQELLGRNER